MRNRILLKTVKTAFRTCPADCILMLLIQLAIVCLPVGGLYVLKWMVDALVGKNISAVLISVVGYCFVNWFQKALQDWYNHYFLMYFSLLRFEKKVKEVFFRICLSMRLDDYNDAEFVNHSLRAKNASVNILRLYQAIVELVCTVFSVIAMGVVINNISSKLIAVFAVMSLTELTDNLFMLYQNKKFLYQNTQLEKEEAELSDLLLRAKSLKEIVLLGGIPFVLEKWKDVVRELLKNEREKNGKIAVFSLCMKSVYCIGTAVAYLFLFRAFLSREIGIGEFSVTVSAFTMLRGVFSSLFDGAANVSQFAILVNPFFEYAMSADRHHRTKNRQEPAAAGDLILKGVSYRYHNAQKNALDKIDCVIENGKKYVIVGENGSGKTTLMKVLLGLFEPTEGEILFGNTRLSDWDERSLYRYYSDVPQDYNIYAVSVQENIAFSGEAEGINVDAALREMELQELLDKKDRIVGREYGGIELSQGQGQKVAILRAENKAGKVFFLDEPTSAVDPLPEKSIFDRIYRAANGKTTIIVSHRLALCKLADCVIVMRQGKIAEMGSHRELMQKKGLYESLYKEQARLYRIS
ncbi:MAG: ABC transporter ATP-binding protein/permease [Lachnospiraceae bacterium]|nr:ABC transporter ATP-binding protein/permease [Lachnospiraceae bacterium]